MKQPCGHAPNGCSIHVGQFAYPAVCGAPDGRIGIFDVEAQQAPLASPLGFAPLSGLPAAVRVACG